MKKKTKYKSTVHQRKIRRGTKTEDHERNDDYLALNTTEG